MNKIKKYLSRQYDWYIHNLHKIIFVIGIHFISYYIVNLPYVNVFTSLFSFLPYLLDWIVILILFKPKKKLILKTGILLFVFGYFFALIRFNFILEALGQAIFFMIGTYIIMALRELREKST